MVERAIKNPETQNVEAAARPNTQSPKDGHGLFSDQLTDEEKRTLASLEICSDANAERLAGLLTALCRSR